MAMNDPREKYKVFIDGLVERKESIRARRVRDNTLLEGANKDQRYFNELLTSLSQAQREGVADWLQNERLGSIHDVLVYLTDNEYHLVDNDGELAWEPFGNEMFLDFIARSAGDEWPKE